VSLPSTFSGYDEEPRQALRILSENRAAAIICGMGAPRQEEYLIALKHSTWSSIEFSAMVFLINLSTGSIITPTG
jgi:hypothetical protein